MKTVKYKILRKDDNQVFGPFILGQDKPNISGDLEYLLYATDNDTVGEELYEGDKVSFSSDEGVSGEGEIVWGACGFGIKTKNNAARLGNCRFIKRLGSIYDKDTKGV